LERFLFLVARGFCGHGSYSYPCLRSFGWRQHHVINAIAVGEEQRGGPI